MKNGGVIMIYWSIITHTYNGKIVLYTVLYMYTVLLLVIRCPCLLILIIVYCCCCWAIFCCRLFPIRERGLNWHAEELQLHEIKVT